MTDEIYVVKGTSADKNEHFGSEEKAAEEARILDLLSPEGTPPHTIHPYTPAPQWVPVSERPKADRTLFLTLEGGDDAEEGYLCLATNVWRSSNGNELRFIPTHWIYKFDLLPPLPAPPKETEGVEL